MGQWHSIPQPPSSVNKGLPSGASWPKTQFLQLFIPAVLVLFLPFAIWWFWGWLNNRGRWKVTDNSKPIREHYIKTWHGFTERGKVERRKQKRKETRDKVRNQFLWKTTRADYSWVFWDPDGSKRAEFEQERDSTWLRFLPHWVRSLGHGSLQPMTGPNRSRLGDAEKGLIQSRPFHNSDDDRPTQPFDVEQIPTMHSGRFDGSEADIHTASTGIIMSGALNGSLSTIGTLRKRQVPWVPRRVWAAESEETNRAVHLQLLMPKEELEHPEAPVAFENSTTSPETVHVPKYDILPQTVNVTKGVPLSGNRIPNGRMTSLERGTGHEFLSGHDILTPHDSLALQRSISPPKSITLCESKDQQSSRSQSTASIFRFLAPHPTPLMNYEGRRSHASELSAAAVRELERGLQTALAGWLQWPDTAPEVNDTLEPSKSEDIIAFTDSAIWKKSMGGNFDMSSKRNRSSSSSSPPRRKSTVPASCPPIRLRRKRRTFFRRQARAFSAPDLSFITASEVRDLVLMRTSKAPHYALRIASTHKTNKTRRRRPTPEQRLTAVLHRKLDWLQNELSSGLRGPQALSIDPWLAVLGPFIDELAFTGGVPSRPSQKVIRLLSNPYKKRPLEIRYESISNNYAPVDTNNIARPNILRRALSCPTPSTRPKKYVRTFTEFTGQLIHHMQERKTSLRLFWEQALYGAALAGSLGGEEDTDMEEFSTLTVISSLPSYQSVERNSSYPNGFSSPITVDYPPSYHTSHNYHHRHPLAYDSHIIHEIRNRRRRADSNPRVFNVVEAIDGDVAENTLPEGLSPLTVTESLTSYNTTEVGARHSPGVNGGPIIPRLRNRHRRRDSFSRVATVDEEDSEDAAWDPGVEQYSPLTAIAPLSSHHTANHDLRHHSFAFANIKVKKIRDRLREPYQDTSNIYHTMGDSESTPMLFEKAVDVTTSDVDIEHGDAGWDPDAYERASEIDFEEVLSVVGGEGRDTSPGGIHS